jgi:hypothetical protein
MPRTLSLGSGLGVLGRTPNTMKSLMILATLVSLSACTIMPDGIVETDVTADGGTIPTTVTIGRATCTPTTRDNIGVSAVPGTAWQLYIDTTSQAFDCTGQTPPCWCLGGGTFPLDTYDCPTLPQ